ncbi:cytochrome P450 [Mycena pura]|uniref:Cytochrome P450 n=1 Tax=Mycena pura TaxID=153505 RepID=A0AAD6VR48_9AGAR|nr:cytochrome P450 [Mycena pura]
MWKFHRSMTRPFFSRGRITNFDIFNKHANDAIGQAAARLHEGYAVDIQDVAARFTLDSGTEFLFGESVDSLSAGLAHPSDASLKGQQVQVGRPRFGNKWPLNEFWGDQVIDQFIEPILNDALQDRNQPEPTPFSTSATLTFGVYMLAEHPDVAQRLRAEILDKIENSRRPTHEDLKTMPYLWAFINDPTGHKETLRLYPPVIIYPIFLMYRRTDLWGPDALEFDPDRFLDEGLHKYLTPNPYIFIPFNAGPRICLGQQLVRLLQKFVVFNLAPAAQPEESKPPPSWQSSPLKIREKIIFGTLLTMYAKSLWLMRAEQYAIRRSSCRCRRG